jgi:hypothetical protein
MKSYAVRVYCNKETNINKLKKFWSGDIKVLKDTPFEQEYDMIPPPDFRGPETLEWATAMVDFVVNEIGNEAQVVEVITN